MQARQRLIAATLVLIGIVLSAVVLQATAFSVVRDTASGTDASLGQDPSLAADLGVDPTDFYTAPSPLPAGPMGTLLKSEEITDAPDGVKAWRLLYLSQDHAGKPVPISALYAEPDRPLLSVDRLSLVAVAHGTTGVGVRCGVSQEPFTPHTPGYEYWVTIVQPLVAEGYAVVETDYEGMGAAGTPTYLLDKQGKDVLDSIRAALNFRQPDLDPSKIAIIGHSEGGMVAISAAQQVRSYAPELAVRGSVSLAPGLIPPIPFAMASLVKQTDTTGSASRTAYITVLSKSWSAVHPDLFGWNDILTEQGQQTIPAVSEKCQGEMVNNLPGAFTDYIRTSLPPGLVTAAAKEMPVNQASDVPVLILQGNKDISVVPQLSESLLVQLCNLGGTVDYQAFPDDVHRSIQWTGRVTYMDWIADRFAGEPAPTQCGGLQP